MTESALTVVSSVSIHRPLEHVREHFFDLDHAIRDRIHDNVQMRWLPSRTPGERRILREVRILGIPHVDQIVVEEGPQGERIDHYVEGTNAGTEIVTSFQSEGPERTRVEIQAKVAISGFRWAVGPLLKIAVKKMLEKTLQEHKRDLEGNYQPRKARGNLAAALEPVQSALARAHQLATDEQRVAFLAPILEAACVTAIADNTVDDAERDTIHAVIKAMGVHSLDDDAVDAIIASSIDRTRHDGIERRCDELGARLAELDLAEAGLSVAALVAQVSHGIDPSELAILQRLARAASVSDETLALLIDRIDQRLSQTQAQTV